MAASLRLGYFDASTGLPLDAVTLGTTPIGHAGSNLADGSYQRAYEHRFEERLPTAHSAAQVLAALRLALFEEVAEGAVLGSEGWLFTAE